MVDGKSEVVYGLFLPPANEVCEGYVFAGVCLSTEGWGRAWHVAGEGACLAGGIRSMSGRYASYWNAFLLPMLSMVVEIE